jgi:hypothetical protein
MHRGKLKMQDYDSGEWKIRKNRNNKDLEYNSKSRKKNKKNNSTSKKEKIRRNRRSKEKFRIGFYD